MRFCCLVWALMATFGVSQGQVPTLVCPQGVVIPAGGTRDWSLRYAKCYLAIAETDVTWEEASRLCQRFGGRLAEPAGVKLTEEVGAIAAAADPTLTRLWIGYNRRGLVTDMTQGQWSDGRPTLADVGVWGSQQPDINAGECTYLLRHSATSWTWHLGNCDLDLPFMCQATPCTDDTFRCDNGQCVGQSNVCNQENNCGDNSDERDCPGRCSYHKTEKQGTVDYPDTGGDYLPSQTCQWVLEGAVGSRLQIQFASLHTEQHVDFVEVWVGGRTLSASTLVRRVSGNSTQDMVVSSNNMAIIRFVSDGSYQNSGFIVTWQSEFQCSVTETSGQRAGYDDVASRTRQLGRSACGSECRNDASCVASVYNRFTGTCAVYNYMPRPSADTCCTLFVNTCPGYSTLPGVNVLPGEGGDLYATSSAQRFSSPLYPSHYVGDMVTQWTIHAPGRQIVTLQILDLDLAPGDAILVFDGDTSMAQQLATMSGNDVTAAGLMTADDQKMVLSTQNKMLVQFVSLRPSQARGFLFAYQAGCTFDLLANTGQIVSPGYQTDLYPNVLACQWTIQVQAGRTLTLTFDSGFNLENGNDFLQITADGSQVHTGSGFTGATLPTGLVAQIGRVQMSLTTSATGRAAGFRARFNAGCATVVDPTLAKTYSADFDQSIVVQCASDYVFSGIHSGQNSVGIYCQRGGTWSSDPFPTCARVFCGPPRDIAHGYLVQVTGPYSGDSASYACETGFQLSFSTPIKCRNTGSWDQPPFCFSIQSCPSIQDPFQGRYLVTAGNGLEHGSVINFTCTNPQYELRGVANLICENGQWSDSVPTCERISCAVPYLANGTVSPSVSVVVGQTLRIDCNPGFTLDGPSIFVCGEKPQASCINIDECQGGSSCSGGCVDTEGSFYCTCSAGYALLSDRRTCSDLDECSLNNGNCDGLCSNTPGSYRCQCVGNSLLYTYDGQFGIDLPPGETGTEPWNIYHLNHTCIQTPTVECPQLPQSISNGHLLGETSTFTVGQVVTYLCDLGYVAQGPTTLSCQSTGDWSSPVPTCVEATCLVPVVPIGDVSPQTPTRYLDYVTVTCTLTGVNPRTLRSRCIWDQKTQSYRVDTDLLRCDTSNVDCGTPKRLPGSLPYLQSSTRYSAQFAFTCRAPLFRRVGKSGSNSEVVTCGADGVWDFGDLRCEGPTCPDPGTNAGTQQVATTYEEFALVSYTCERSGFSLTSTQPLFCQYDPVSGALQWNGTAPTCTDTQPPSFANCPSSVREVTYLGSAFFAEPQASDNVMVKDLTLTPNDFRVSDVVQTDFQVSYIARDHAANIGSCVVDIRVKDESPPQIRCRNSSEVQLFAETQRAVYDPLNFVLSQADNSGIVSLTFSVNPLIIDRYSIGRTHTVKIDASDPAGNSDSCLVQFKVTGPPCLPWTLNVNDANVTCFQQSNNGYRCDVQCKTGFKFSEDPDLIILSISCNYGSKWNRAPPVCTPYYYTNYRLAFRMQYQTRENPSLQCESGYTTELTGKLATLTNDLTSLCSSVSPQVAVSSAANINPVSVTAYNDGIYAIIRLDLETVSGPGSESAISQCVNIVSTAFASVSSSLDAIRSLSGQGGCARSELVRYGNKTQSSINCQNNQESRVEPSTGRYQCVSCIPGYTSAIGSKCTGCGEGSYYDSATGSCQFCPTGTRSQQFAARNIEECYLHCPFGDVSSTGEAPCTPCPEHTYSLNRTYCAACPPGLFTRGDAQGYESSCRSACDAGTFSYDGLSPCTQCPQGFYQSQKGTSTCTECARDRTTDSRGSTRLSDCVDAAQRVCNPNPCFNGTCVVINHDYSCLCSPGYTGRNCQTLIRPCDSNPCFNGAFCKNKNNSDYECVCTKAMTSGRNCEDDDEDDCDVGPCHNFGACQDRIGSHICLCPSFSNYTYASGLAGSDCTQLRDPCQEDPCLNGATCDNRGSIRRKCFCADGYEGESCQIDKEYCQTDNPCQYGAQCQDGAGPQVSCTCLPGYTGDRCEVRLDLCSPSTCGLYSSCVDIYTSTSSNVQCYCSQGFTEVNGVCQLIVIDTCKSSPCENNSTCLRDGNGYQCRCLPGYEGANCQHNVDDCRSIPCQNGGSCIDGLNGFQCDCPADTTGPVCTDAFDQCSGSNNPCNPYGTQTCIDYYRGYSCICLGSYYGVNCTEGKVNCASFPCRYGGTCTDAGSSYVCKCPDGFQGPNCEFLQDYCASQPCLNEGTCVNTDTGTVCKCRPGYRGDRCQIRYDMCAVADPCVTAGSTCKTDSYNQVSCNCPAGYTGQYCEVNLATCQTDTCKNGGTCNDAAGYIICSCPAGFSGQLCELNEDNCAGVTCPANAYCVDGNNTYSCVCADEKIGDSCYKDLSLNFDLILEHGTNYLSSDPLTWPLLSSALSAATWIRFTERTTPGTVMALYGLNTVGDVTNPQHLVRIERSSVTLDFAGTKTLTLSPAIDDGFWHHVALTWDGRSGRALVYVDNQLSTTTMYGQGVRLASYGWVILGGTYNSVAQTIDRSQGMVGRLSRLHVTTNAMSSANVSRLYADPSYVPAGSQWVLTKELLNGTTAVVDYQSQLTQGVCRTAASSCRSLDNVVSRPSVTQCPENQMLVSQRRSTPSWNTPSFLSNLPVTANYVSGNTEMGWGHYGLAYTQSDSDGDTAVCSFHLHNRRGTCNNPVPPRFGSQSCRPTSAGIRCEVSCQTGYTRSQAEPLFYTCGIYGMFGASDRLMTFHFPSCTTCQTPKVNIRMELNYTIPSMLVCATATTQLPGNIRSSLATLNTKWQGGICGNTLCDGVQVTVDCPSTSSQHVKTTVNLLELDDVVRSDNVNVKSVTEVLTVAVVDSGDFSYSGTTPDLTSLIITPSHTCPEGKVLLNDCCIACGLGHYYNTDTGRCSACRRGTYLDELDKTGSLINSSCKACPSGQTTPFSAAQSEIDCTDSCQYGSYFNMSTQQCQVCPVGFYSENPGSYYCDGCPYQETTVREGSTASVSCAVNPITTEAPATTSTDDPNAGASTGAEDMSWPEILLLVLGLIVLVVVILLVLFFCFRQHLVKWCPCLVTKVKPQDRTGWHYVDRFGETKMKFASYNLGDLRSRNSDRDLLDDSVEEGSVHTNISLQVPVFEEKLNEMVKKKSVHVSEHKAEKREKRRKKKRSRKPADLSSTTISEHTAPSQIGMAAPVTTELPADGTVRRPPSAFNRPRPTLDDVPYDNFVSPRVYENVDSVSNPPRSPSTGRRTARIMIDSDDDER